MKNLPIFLRVIINIFLYFVYLIFFWFLFGLIFPIILEFLNKPILNPNNPIFDKIAILLAFIILLFTVFFRKYFYMNLEESSYDKKINLINKNKKDNKNIENKEKETQEKNHSLTNDDLEIFVGKEK